jgi:predicted phosphodiesterase
MTSQLRLAFLGDIHGNLPALEAALSDLTEQAPDGVYLLGDLVNRCPWNNEVMSLLDDRDWPGIQGNHDLVIGNLNTPASRPPFTARDRFPIIYWTWHQLETKYIEVLRLLPPDLVVAIENTPAIHLFHGVPNNPFVGIYPETDADHIAETFAPFTEPVFVCAHTHRPLHRTIEGKRVLNGGSIGLPYNGDPRAQYLVLDLVNRRGDAVWEPTFRLVDYDRSHVPDAFAHSGMLNQAGPLAELYMRTVLNGEPWASDFGYWMKDQPVEIQQNLEKAVAVYLRSHGPDNWAFMS